MKPGLKLTLGMTPTEGDIIEVRLPLGVRRDHYVAWLLSDEAEQSFEAWQAAH
jgi:hypothetical protein